MLYNYIREDFSLLTSFVFVVIFVSALVRMTVATGVF